MTAALVTSFFDKATNNVGHLVAAPVSGPTSHASALYRWQTRAAQQRSANVHVYMSMCLSEEASEDEFVAMRTKRGAGLGVPKLMNPSVQTNIRAGEFLCAEDNEMRCLEVRVEVP